MQKNNIYNLATIESDTPADCAQKLIEHKTDIGLVPVATIPLINNAEVISDYCIAADGKVESVLLVSHVELKKIKSITLDKESRTSVLLAQLLAKKYWNINPVWIDETGNQLENAAAAVLIGDRALQYRDLFPFVYDLAEEWKKLTGLPFVFACWVTNKKLEEDFITLFNTSLQYGVDHIEELSLTKGYSALQKKYLLHSIQYKLNDQMKTGLNLFLEMAEELEKSSYSK